MKIKKVLLLCFIFVFAAGIVFAQEQAFKVTIENVSTETTLNPSDGSHQPVPMSPGVWAVHTSTDPLFTSGQPDRGEGLEAIAEDGNPSVLAPNLVGQAGIIKSNFFNTPAGDTMPGPIGPGKSYEFYLRAKQGDKLSFVTMFVPSNDLFFSPDGNGIDLFNSGVPVSGDVTDQIMLWDAGTELNEEPGVGPNQVQRQSAPNTGPADTNNTVRLVNDQFTYPHVDSVIKVTITPVEETNFTVMIENVSTGTTLNPSDGSHQPVPLSPGVWVIHTMPDPLFTEGQPDYGKGLESIAEDGNPSILAPALAADTNFSASGFFNTPVGDTSPGAIGPGGAYQFSFSAIPGEKFSFVTMFVPSNDLFFGPDGSGINLFNSSIPISGDVTSRIMLWDAGTELNEEPGVGPNQVQRQSGPNTGPADTNNTVRLVNDQFTYPDVDSVIKVTVSSSPVGIRETASNNNIPSNYRLEQNYPNPFNPSTTIKFSLPVTDHIKLEVFNILGQKAATLINGLRNAGNYTVNWDASGFSSGVYIFRLAALNNNIILSRKMILLK